MDRFEDAKLRVKESADLVQIITGYLPLRQRGQTMVGLCPFHGEKTPSFTVYPSSQHFKCYGCGKAGDVFTFLQEREGLTFREAMEQLAENAGISLDGVFAGGQKRPSGGPIAHEVLGTVRDWFIEILHGEEGAEARAYLESRGLQSGSAAFGLGAHPARPGRLLQFVRDRKLPREVLEQAGLIGRTGREVHQGRLMFPIADERGRVLGFGGRVLPSAEEAGARRDRKPPKYLNSPESPFFAKRRLLYGLGQVKAAGERNVVVVEGYTDVIACHLAGFEGAVATLGTALTTEHSRTLERWAQDGVVLLFDGDTAGRRAADRAFRELVHTALPVRIALLPEGEDPADLAGLRPGTDPERAEAGRAALRERIDGAQDALTVWFRLLREREDLSTDAGVQRAAKACAEVVQEVEDAARREGLIAGMARHLAMPDTVLRGLLRSPRRRGGPQAAAARDDGPDDAALEAAAAPTADANGVVEAPAQPVTADRLYSARLDLIACVLSQPDLANELADDAFEGPVWSRIRGVLQRGLELGNRDAESLSKHAFAAAEGPDDPLHGVLADSLDRSRRMRDPRSMFDQGCRGVTSYFAKQETRRIRVAIEAARADGDVDQVRALSQQLFEILRRQRSLASESGDSQSSAQAAP